MRSAAIGCGPAGPKGTSSSATRRCRSKSRRFASNSLDGVTADPIDIVGLTLKEQRLIRTAMRGATNKEIAARLGLREQTVKNHLSRVFRKVGVRNRVELAIYGSRHLPGEEPQ